MKKKFILLAIVLSFYSASWSQTSYGNLEEGNAGKNGDGTNSYFGSRAGMVSTGASNTFIGYFSGAGNTLGSNNTFLGDQAGRSNTFGNANTYLGFNSGFTNQFGSGNVFLGYQAGLNETGSNLLYIDNSDISSPLIWGDFAANALRFYGTVRITDIPEDNANALTRILVTDIDGNINWRDVLSIGDGVDDADADPTNELQTLTYDDVAQTLFISGGNDVDLSSLAGGGGTPHDFPSYPDSAGDNGDNTNSYFGHEAGLNNTNSGLRNTFIGHQSGLANTNQDDNTFIGYLTGANNVSSDNVFIGSYSGEDNTWGSSNTFVGYQSGRNNTGGASGNTFIGHTSGLNNDAGDSNTFLGNNSGQSNTGGDTNTFIGNASGYSNQIGGQNTFIGSSSGHGNINADRNTFLGYYSGRTHSSGDDNTFIGHLSGENNETGEGNVFIGHSAGRDATGSGNVFIGTDAGSFATGSNQLYINNSANSPLIWGDFANEIIRFDANVGIGIGQDLPDATLAVRGDIHTQQVRVDLNGVVAPDFVFEPDYQLRTLAETERYIKANKHLPEIPSAAEMEENGFELKEMNLKLLQKIEELTLYTIEQQKLIEEMRKEIEIIKNKK